MRRMRRKSDAKVKKRKKGGNVGASRLMQLWTLPEDTCAARSQKQRREGGQRRRCRTAPADIGKVFEHKPVDEILGAQFADEWVKQLDYWDVIPPGKEEFPRFLSKTLASGPAPDGQPCAAWKHAGAHGLETLKELELFTRRGHTLGLELVRSNTVFKGDEICDDVECVRSASDVRPLGVCAVWNQTLRVSVATLSCECPGGYVAVRVAASEQLSVARVCIVRHLLCCVRHTKRLDQRRWNLSRVCR